MPLQIRRGTDAERQAMVVPLAPGELLYTTNTQQIYVGDGITIGGILTSGFTTNDAKDAAADMIVNGNHQKISFLYNTETKTLDASVDILPNEGPLRADAFVGSVFADDSTLLVDAVNGRIVAPVFADLTGSVFANDLNLLIDAENKTIVINSVEAVSGTIGISGIFSFEGANTESLILENSSELPDSNSISFKKSRGIVGNLSPVVNGDTLSSINISGYTGVDYFLSASIVASVDGTVSGLSVPSKLSFNIQSQNGDFKNPFEIASNQFDGRALIKLSRERGSSSNPIKVESGDSTHEISFQSYDGDKYLSHARIIVDVNGVTDIDDIPSTLNLEVLKPGVGFLRAFQIDSNGSVNIYKSIYEEGILRVFQRHETQDSANIEFFRSRGTDIIEESILQNDDIIDFAFLAYNNGAYRPSAGIKIKAVDLVGNRVVSNILLAMDNGSDFAERFVIESSGTIDFKQAPLVVGTDPGEVDTTAAVEYMRVKLNGVEYAMPLFAINT
jgi:hypothetical protein